MHASGTRCKTERERGKRRFCDQCCRVDVEESRRNSVWSHSLQTHREFYSDERDLREHLERRAQQTVLGKNSAQRKLYLTEEWNESTSGYRSLQFYHLVSLFARMLELFHQLFHPLWSMTYFLVTQSVLHQVFNFQRSSASCGVSGPSGGAPKRLSRALTLRNVGNTSFSRDVPLLPAPAARMFHPTIDRDDLRAPLRISGFPNSKKVVAHLCTSFILKKE